MELVVESEVRQLTFLDNSKEAQSGITFTKLTCEGTPVDALGSALSKLQSSKPLCEVREVAKVNHKMKNVVMICL